MNIKARLTEEHSRALTTAITNYIAADKKKFGQLIDIFFEGEYRLTQRAAWALSEVSLLHPELVKPYFLKLVSKLSEPDHHPAIYRNILRIFQDIEIPEQHCSTLLDTCFNFIQKADTAVAVKAFAITVASNICGRYQGLEKELLLIIGDMAKEPQPPAIRHRIKLAVKELHPADSKH